MKKHLSAIAAALLLVVGASLIQPTAVGAWDGAIDQTADHSGEESMYKYTLELRVDDPCCTSSKDAVEEFWFDFDYLSENGKGAKKTYRFDMSWNSRSNRSLNESFLRSAFWRSNENSYTTTLDLWVPGLITEVRAHLNMDWEEVDVTIGGIWLNGYRVNTDTDYVQSRIWSSNAKIPCFIADSLVVEGTEEAISSAGTLHDQYGGVLTSANADRVREEASAGDVSGFYYCEAWQRSAASQA